MALFCCIQSKIFDIINKSLGCFTYFILSRKTVTRKSGGSKRHNQTTPCEPGTFFAINKITTGYSISIRSFTKVSPKFHKNKNPNFSETSISLPDSNGKTKIAYLTKNIFIYKLRNDGS